MGVGTGAQPIVGLVSSLYNIVDQIFIGQGVGYLGNGAINVVFPVFALAFMPYALAYGGIIIIGLPFSIIGTGINTS